MKDYIGYVFIAAIAVMSVAMVVLGLLRSRGALRKMLLCSVLLLGWAALFCIGSQAVLALFDMGWRWAPYNAMLILCFILFVVMLVCCMIALFSVENTHAAILAPGFLSLLLMLFISLTLVPVYFHLSKWHDSLASYDGQTIVCANDCNGGSGSWRYYTHINSMVHGGELFDDGSRWGYPSHWSWSDD